MNNFICKIVTHRKTISDNLTQLYNYKSISSKPKLTKKINSLHPNRTQSRQLFHSKGTFDTKSINLIHQISDNNQRRQFHTSVNSKRNINKANKRLRSNSYDNYLLVKPKDLIYNHIIKAFFDRNKNIKVKNYKNKLNQIDNNNNYYFQPVLTQQSLNQTQKPFSYIGNANTHSVRNKVISNQKGLLIKSPLVKQLVKNKTAKVQIKDENHNDYQKNDIQHSEPNTLEKEKKEVKKKIKVYHMKINDEFSFKKSKHIIIPHLLTQQNEFSERAEIDNNNNNENKRELSPTLSERKTDQSTGNQKKQNKKTPIPHPDSDCKYSFKNKIQINGKCNIYFKKIDFRERECKKTSLQINALFQDIIRNNINYTQKQNRQMCFTDNIDKQTNQVNISHDHNINKTPQLNKYLQLYPQTYPLSSNKQRDTYNDRKNIKDTIIDQVSVISIHSKITSDCFVESKASNLHSSKPTTSIAFNERDLIINTEGDIVPSNNDALETDCHFEEEEGFDIITRKEIPSFSPKHLSTYNCITESGISDLEILFKTKTIFPLILSLIDYESLAALCTSNTFFRKQLKEIQYRWTAYLVFDPLHLETKIKIRKSVWKYSKLPKDSNTIKQIYSDYLYNKSPYDEEIRKDLSRTFPNDNSFKRGNKNYIKLYHILSAYSNYNQSIGYAQGLNFLVANSLFLFNQEHEVFVFVDGLINRFHLEQLLGVGNILKQKLDEIGRLLRKSASRVMMYLDEIGLGHEFFTANWLLTLFSNSLRKQYLFYIWDFMIIYGKMFMNYFIASIIIKYSNKIIDYDQSHLSQLMKGLLKSDHFEKEFKSIIGNAFELMRIYSL